MGTDTKYFSPITLTVGDELTLRGTFSIWTFAEINDYCLPFIGCVPGAGPYAVTQTVGNFGTVLNIEELQPPSSVPEPGVLSLFSLGLLGLGFARRWCAG